MKAKTLVCMIEERSIKVAETVDQLAPYLPAEVMKPARRAWVTRIDDSGHAKRLVVPFGLVLYLEEL